MKKTTRYDPYIISYPFYNMINHDLYKTKMAVTFVLKELYLSVVMTCDQSMSQGEKNVKNDRDSNPGSFVYRVNVLPTVTNVKCIQAS